MAKEERAPGVFYSNKYGIFGESVITPIGRAAFLNLETPSTIGPEPKYGLTLLVEKSDEKAKIQLRAIQDMCLKMAFQKYGTEAAIKEAFMKFKYPIFRDGDSKPDYVGFPDNYFMRLNNKDIRKIEITRGNVIQDFIAGMKVRAQVQPFMGQDGFSYKLTGLTLIEDDGVRFAGGPPGAGLLEELEEATQAANASGVVGSGLSVL